MALYIRDEVRDGAGADTVRDNAGADAFDPFIRLPVDPSNHFLFRTKCTISLFKFQAAKDLNLRIRQNYLRF